VMCSGNRADERLREDQWVRMSACAKTNGYG
jgi:hypothetical protein